MTMIAELWFVCCIKKSNSFRLRQIVEKAVTNLDLSSDFRIETQPHARSLTLRPAWVRLWLGQPLTPQLPDGCFQPARLRRRHTSEWCPGWFKYARARISQACQWPPDLLQNRSGTRPPPPPNYLNVEVNKRTLVLNHPEPRPGRCVDESLVRAPNLMWLRNRELQFQQGVSWGQLAPNWQADFLQDAKFRTASHWGVLPGLPSPSPNAVLLPWSAKEMSCKSEGGGRRRAGRTNSGQQRLWGHLERWVIRPWSQEALYAPQLLAILLPFDDQVRTQETIEKTREHILETGRLG